MSNPSNTRPMTAEATSLVDALNSFEYCINEGFDGEDYTPWFNLGRLREAVVLVLRSRNGLEGAAIDVVADLGLEDDYAPGLERRMAAFLVKAARVTLSRAA